MGCWSAGGVAFRSRPSGVRCGLAESRDMAWRSAGRVGRAKRTNVVITGPGCQVHRLDGHGCSSGRDRL
jgi:hypothetical protein